MAKNRLKEIEDDTFSMGKQAKKEFDKTGSLPALRGSIVSYRTAMQAMRYQLKYTVKTK